MGLTMGDFPHMVKSGRHLDSPEPRPDNHRMNTTIASRFRSVPLGLLLASLLLAPLGCSISDSSESSSKSLSDSSDSSSGSSSPDSKASAYRDDVREYTEESEMEQ